MELRLKHKRRRRCENAVSISFTTHLTPAGEAPALGRAAVTSAEKPHAQRQSPYWGGNKKIRATAIFRHGPKDFSGIHDFAVLPLIGLSGRRSMGIQPCQVGGRTPTEAASSVLLVALSRPRDLSGKAPGPPASAGIPTAEPHGKLSLVMLGPGSVLSRGVRQEEARRTVSNRLGHKELAAVKADFKKSC